MPFINYYKILQVDPSAEQEIIVAAFKRLAIKYHPDLNKAENTTTRMQEINAAYEILSDPQRRASYNLDYEVKFGLKTYESNNDVHPMRKAETPQPIENLGQLLHQSDFNYSSNFWQEGYYSDHQTFRKDGYYYIKVLRVPWEVYQYPNISVVNFRAVVCAIFSNLGDSRSECGIVFKVNQNSNRENYYRFAISKSGYYSLFMHLNNQYHNLVDYCSSVNINRYGINHLTVEMIGQNIKVGVNGQTLRSVHDNSLFTGSVGILASASESITEVKFRDFRLYSY